MIAPVSIAVFVSAYLGLHRISPGKAYPSRSHRVGSAHTSQSHVGTALASIALSVICLYFSWFAFWLSATVVLGLNLLAARRNSIADHYESFTSSGLDRLVLFLLICMCVAWEMSISRPDLDDAFYVGVAAFTRSHPTLPLLHVDPMFGEQNWPLLFPSYKMSAYEVLGGAVAYIANITAMDAMYRVLPPVFSALVVVPTALFAREIAPRRWLSITITTIVLIAVLGETHRGFANFGFDRIFQGKAILVTVMIPSIYYLTWRFLRTGRPDDWLLLAFAQLGAIGLSGFAMLIAPIAGLSALIAGFAAIRGVPSRRLTASLCTLCVCVPYLLWVAIATHGGASMFALANESPENVWTTVFGPTQQFFIAILMLSGPAFARDSRTKVLLAAPWLILFAVFLNPLFAPLISRHVTTPPVYWRCVWLLPALPFTATALCEVLEAARSRMHVGNSAVWMTALIAVLALLCLPLNTFRVRNNVMWNFNGLKVPPADLDVASMAVRLTPAGSRMLAPDSVAGVVAAMDQHPQLVNVRHAYLDMFAPFLGVDGHAARMTLADFASGLPVSTRGEIGTELQRLNVGLIVLSNDGPESMTARETLKKERDFCAIADGGPYSVWMLRSADRQTECKMDLNR
jgi:hypothetical protein